MTKITVTTTVHAPIATVWKHWSDPESVKRWCFASDDWEVRGARGTLEVNKTFTTTMAAKDGSASFDMTGTYQTITTNELIEYTMEDGRHVRVEFHAHGDHVHIKETFDAESTHSLELQQQGWQAILDNFKKFVETQ